MEEVSTEVLKQFFIQTADLKTLILLPHKRGTLPIWRSLIFGNQDWMHLHRMLDYEDGEKEYVRLDHEIRRIYVKIKGNLISFLMPRQDDKVLRKMIIHRVGDLKIMLILLNLIVLVKPLMQVNFFDLDVSILEVIAYMMSGKVNNE